MQKSLTPYLLVSPLVFILTCFLALPILVVVIVSFCSYDEFSIIFSFTLENYRGILTSPVTWGLFKNTFYFAGMTWIITLVVGFWVSYYLVFHVRSILWQIGLFLLCTVPFWTSNIIRMISWIPLLGKEGLVNSALIDAGIVHEPLTGLLYSDFSVILAYVHLYTLFMIVPIFNTMARIDPALIEAAVDGGAKPWQVIWRVILPLSKTGIALGSIFVVAVVMGDFFVVRTMSGGQSGSVVSGMMNQISLLQYPVAAAGSVILLIVVTLMIMAVFAVVDVRREMAVR
jgi:putative spermidine/putrescine transport system permease protein